METSVRNVIENPVNQSPSIEIIASNERSVLRIKKKLDQRNGKRAVGIKHK